VVNYPRTSGDPDGNANGRVRVPVNPLDFKNDPGGILHRRFSPLLDRIQLLFLAFTDLDGFITFRLD
jgi:hypothetical protein